MVLSYILLSWHVRKRMMGQGFKLDSFSFGKNDSSSDINGHIKYYCMLCGTEHNKDKCPKCSSKMKKATF
jgi:rubrerythrin